MAKMIYRKDTGEILGVHIFGLHAADLIHEASNAVATRQTVNVRTLGPLPRSCTGACMCEACSACRERASARPALWRVLSNLVKAHVLHMSRKTDVFSGVRAYGCAE